MKHKKQLDKNFVLIKNLAILTKNEQLKWQYLNDNYYTLMLNNCILTIKRSFLDGVILTINDDCNNEIIYYSEYRFYDVLIHLYRIVRKKSIKEFHINKTNSDLLIENINNILEEQNKVNNNYYKN